MTTWTRLAVVGAASTVLLGAAALLTLPSGATADGEVEGPPAVRVARVQAAPSTRAVRLMGITRARDRSAIGFTLGGRLAERPVDVGSEVQAGDVLARLDPAPLLNNVRQADARLAEVQSQADQLARDRARLVQLRGERAVSAVELERIEAQERSVLAALDQARTGYDEALRLQREGVLRAPYPATVTQVLAQTGETVAAGQPLLTLSGAGTEVALEAPESVWVDLSPGLRVDVRLPGVDCELEGTLTTIGEAAAGPGQLFPVHVQVPSMPDCRVVSGLTAEVDVWVPQSVPLAVPVRAVSAPTGNRARVFRVVEGRAAAVDVTPGRLAGDLVTVSADLDVGDEVVIGGLIGLTDGQAVTVQR